MNIEKKIFKNSLGLRILTDAGYKSFSGVALMGKKKLNKVSFIDGSYISVTSGHRFFTPMLDEVKCCELKVGDLVYGKRNDFEVTSIETLEEDEVYDVIDVDSGSRYFTNGILSHNCEFISSDALLISSAVSQLVEKRAKIFAKDTQILNDITFWEKIKSNETYLIAIDPSTGNGQDFSVMTVVHFPSMVQVAEYRANTTSSPDLYRKLKWIIGVMERIGSHCYFSVENNGVGEGIIALFMNDEQPPLFAEFVSDSTGNRLGMNTNGRTKIKSCINFKEMVESDKITIKSSITPTEMKSYIRKKGSFEAQPGGTDDCIASWLIIIRILEEISTYEQDAFDKLYTYGEDYDVNTEEYDENDPDNAPLPIVF